MPRHTLDQWKDFIQQIPGTHILQSPAWGELKSTHGWEAEWLIKGDLGAQVLFQKLPLGYQVAYLPRGPVSKSGNAWQSPNLKEFQTELDQICLERNAVFLKVEPDGWEDEAMLPPGFKKSAHSIQPPRTLVISLLETEDEILSRMKSKTRYNIRLAEKKGIDIKELDDIQLFYDLLEHTSDRAEFGIHTLAYYQDVFRIFKKSGECKLFLAEFEGLPLASIMVFLRGNRSWYFYGASSGDHREKMPTYLVQWEAIRWARQQGCVSYDLWGVPDYTLETLEEQFTNRSDDLWGVYRFKRGFGGELRRSPGPWDKVYKPALYNLYKIRNRFTTG